MKAKAMSMFDRFGSFYFFSPSSPEIGTFGVRKPYIALHTHYLHPPSPSFPTHNTLFFPLWKFLPYDRPLSGHENTLLPRLHVLPICRGWARSSLYGGDEGYVNQPKWKAVVFVKYWQFLKDNIIICFMIGQIRVFVSFY